MIYTVSLYLTDPVHPGSDQLASRVHPPSSSPIISGLKPLR